MDENELKIFMQKQKEEIEKHKWIESEKARQDLGDKATFDWISKYAKLFRDGWNSFKKM